jgi:hypothetical protein
MTVTELPPPAEAEPGTPFASVGEVRPAAGRPADPAAEPKRKWWQRKDRARAAPKITRTPGEARPERGKRRRVSAVDDFTDLFIGAGGMVQNRTRYQATGHAIKLNGSVTAVLADEAVAHTIIDRLAVQPISRNRERFEAGLAIFETPGILFMMERQILAPDLEFDMRVARVEALVPSLERAVRRSLPHMARAIVKVRKREEELRKAAIELYGDTIGDGVDPVVGVVQDLVAPIYAALQQMQADPAAGPIPPGDGGNG